MAHQLLSQSPRKTLSSSFEEAEKSPRGERTPSPGFDGILTNIEHSLGRTDDPLITFYQRALIYVTVQLG